MVIVGDIYVRTVIQMNILLMKKSVKLLRMFEFVDISKIKELNILDRNKKEIDTFLESYYLRYTGLYLKSKDFLSQIK